MNALLKVRTNDEVVSPSPSGERDGLRFSFMQQLQLYHRRRTPEAYLFMNY